MAEVFTAIYEAGQWHNGSGSGSQPANTGDYRDFLAKYIHENELTSAVDVGCGDWKFSWLVTWPEDFAYLGIDVVEQIIRINRHDWTDWGVADIQFMAADVMAMDELPPADLVIVKDVIQHWPNDAIHHLGRLLAGRRALITQESMGGFELNQDIPPGGCRPVNLQLEPFCWGVGARLTYLSKSPGRDLLKTVWEMKPA
jgi:SAM-dependent methyltransferase